MDDVDITSEEFEAIKAEICPPDKPFQCTTSTKSMGLCRKKPEDCRDRKIKYDSDKTTVVDSSGANQYGYHTNNLTDFGGDFSEEYTVRYEKSDKLPKVFKVLTWNIWGMIKRKDSGAKYMLLSELMMLRMDKIVKEIAKRDPDVVILQEMSYESLGLIRGYMRQYGLLGKYHGYGENFTKYTPGNMESSIGRDLETYVFSKYVPEFITQYSLSGNLGYTTGVVFVSFGEVCVVGCYLQAGSKNSPGQESVWFHYARCRREQLEAIGQMITKTCPKSTVILCGDFNMHLDGNKKEWPEIKGIKELEVSDTWRIAYPDMDEYPGFTEDTSINHMRWNMKFMEKHYRYDGIFLKNSGILLSVDDCAMVGLQGFPMDDDMYKEFLRVLSNKSSRGEPRSQTYHPSDHFGIMTTFSI